MSCRTLVSNKPSYDYYSLMYCYIKTLRIDVSNDLKLSPFRRKILQLHVDCIPFLTRTFLQVTCIYTLILGCIISQSGCIIYCFYFNCIGGFTNSIDIITLLLAAWETALLRSHVRREPKIRIPGQRIRPLAR